MDYDQPTRGPCADSALVQNRPSSTRYSTRTRSILWGSVFAVVCMTFGASVAQAAASPLLSVSTTAQNRNESIKAIPFDQMGEQVKARVWRVVSKPSIYRRLPTQTIDCDPDLYVFLVRYPEVLVNIWQLMGVTKVQMKRTGPFSFDASDGVGTTTKVELVYGRPDLHVYYANGFYEGPLLHNRITGRCVIVLRSAYAKQGDRLLVTVKLDTFVDLDNIGAEIFAKTLHPLIGKTADFNFTETARFMGQVSQASETNGPGMERLAAKLSNVDPAVRQSFAQYTDVVYQRAVLRRAARAPLPASAATYTAPSGVAQPSAAAAEPVIPRRRTPIFRR